MGLPDVSGGVDERSVRTCDGVFEVSVGDVDTGVVESVWFDIRYVSFLIGNNTGMRLAGPVGLRERFGTDGKTATLRNTQLTLVRINRLVMRRATDMTGSIWRAAACGTV